MASQDISAPVGQWTNLITAPATDLTRGKWYRMTMFADTDAFYREAAGTPTETGGHYVSPGGLFAFKPPAAGTDSWIRPISRDCTITITEAE